MARGIFVDFDASHHAVVELFVLGAILVLPLARMLATCRKCSFNLSLLAIEPKSLQQRQLHRNHNFGTATGSKMVLSRDSVVQTR